jgi:hypothetical protein
MIAGIEQAPFPTPSPALSGALEPDRGRRVSAWGPAAP